MQKTKAYNSVPTVIKLADVVSCNAVMEDKANKINPH